MKKLTLIAAFAAVSIFATSCSKEKDCECVTDVAGLTSTTDVTIEDGDCSDMDSETTTMGITSTVTCTEK